MLPILVADREIRRRCCAPDGLTPKIDAIVFHWMMGTGLRPFAAALKSPLKEQFLEHYRGLLARAYLSRPGGKTIHRFLRLFFVVSA